MVWKYGRFSLACVIMFWVVISSASVLWCADKSGVLFGLFREGASRNMRKIEKFEQLYSIRPSSIMWYLDWKQPFPLEACKRVRDYGAIPHIVWEPWVWGEPDAPISLQLIIDGYWDDWIRRWARGVAQYQDPIFIRYAHEFNIEGYPWCTVHNGRSSDQYIAAWRHVVDIYREEGAHNALFVWSPMNRSFPEEPWNDYMKAYPGDDYVDWIGIDGYNWGASRKWSQWLTLEQLFYEPVRRISRAFPTKPIMIAEFGSAESGGSKAKWIADMGLYLKTSLKQVKGIYWFDLGKETDWHIASSLASSRAFRQAMQDPVFLVDNGEAWANVSVNYTHHPRARNIQTAKFTRKEKYIDGYASDWPNNYHKIQAIDNVASGVAQWDGVADISGRFQLAWDHQFLYVIAIIRDDVPFTNHKRNRDIWDGDAVEIVLGLDPNADPRRTRFGTMDFQIGITPGNRRDTQPMVWIWQIDKQPAYSYAKGQETEDGYSLEAKIPWQDLGDFIPQPGKTLDFDIALDDADTDHRDVQVVLFGDASFYKDPSVWGKIRLVGEK